jgi:hypothetical protein
VRESWPGVALIGALGFAWIAARRRRDWTPTLGLLVFTAVAAFGTWRGAPAVWMLAGIVAALAAWDLDHFGRRLRGTPVEGEVALARAHLRRLLLVSSAGLLVGWFALGIRVELGFSAALALGLLVVVALSRAIGLLRREAE